MGGFIENLNIHAHKVILNVNKIAVLRANVLGDFIFAIPALEALKKTYPEAELVYLGNRWHQDFLKGRPGPVDRVVVIPKYNGIPKETDRIVDEIEVAEFFNNMRAEEFDIAFQMHGGGGHSNPFLLNLGARLTVGLRDIGAPALDINVPYYLYQHEVLRYLEVVARVGARIERIEPHVETTEANREELYSSVPHLRRPYAVLHPGASEIQRRWPVERFSLLGDFMSESGLNIYISGTAEEEHIAERVIAGMKSRAWSVCGKISINALPEFLQEAEILISNDTGPLHLARAVSTPTVGIYWVGNAITASAMTAAGNRICISWRTSCPLCGMDCIKEDVHHPSGTCSHNTTFVSDVAVEEVLIHSRNLLDLRIKVLAASEVI